MLNSLEWLSNYVQAITGRPHTTAQLKVLQASLVITGYPDARLWNNRAVTIASNVGSTRELALAAGLAISEAWVYGIGAISESYLLLQALARSPAGVDDTAVLNAHKQKFGRWAGYGRPMTNHDERLGVIRDIMLQLGLAPGKHFQLAQNLGQVLEKRPRPLAQNQASASAAIFLDIGFTRDEMIRFSTFRFLLGMYPLLQFAQNERPGTLFAARCVDVGPISGPQETPPAGGFTELRSPVGGAHIGQSVHYHQKELHREMRDWSWLQVWAYGATGREWSDAELTVTASVLSDMTLALSDTLHVSETMGCAHTTPIHALVAQMLQLPENSTASASLPVPAVIQPDVRFLASLPSYGKGYESGLQSNIATSMRCDQVAPIGAAHKDPDSLI